MRDGYVNLESSQILVFFKTTWDEMANASQTPKNDTCYADLALTMKLSSCLLQMIEVRVNKGNWENVFSITMSKKWRVYQHLFASIQNVWPERSPDLWREKEFNQTTLWEVVLRWWATTVMFWCRRHTLWWHTLTYHLLAASRHRHVEDLVLARVAVGWLPASGQRADGGVHHLQILHTPQRLCGEERDQGTLDTACSTKIDVLAYFIRTKWQHATCSSNYLVHWQRWH